MRDRTRAISDDALRCFVLWSRANQESIVSDPVIARSVLNGYAATIPASEPGEPVLTQTAEG